MRDASVWARLLGVEKTVVEAVDFDEDEELLVAHVRPRATARLRCGRCGRPCPRYDAGEGRRRWRTLDLGTTRAVLEADAARVSCAEHGVIVAQVPWARHGAGHTYAFDQQVAWLATQCSKSAVVALMRIAWRTVGAIIARVWQEVEQSQDRFAGLRRIGIDEISYKRGHKYLTIIIDHDTGRVVWVAAGRDRATLATFFDALGPQRCAEITHVSADGADWIAAVVAARCPGAVRAADPFHVVRWATEALDAVRRDAWNAARRSGHTARNGRGDGKPRRDATGPARALKHARFALWKNPEDLTTRQQAKLDWIAKTDPRLYRAYLLKEGLRVIFKLPHDQAADALDRWTSWARRCQIEPFVALQRKITTHRPSILASIEHGLSNGRVESANTKIRLLTRLAFGFANPQALIALTMLSLGGHRPTLPGRT